MSEAPRPHTVEEMRDLFIGQIQAQLEYWATTDLNRPEFKAGLDAMGETRYRMSGLVFGILVLLDGCTDLPAFDLIPSPHASDKEFHRDNGENWWDPVVINECQLHELWGRLRSPSGRAAVKAGQ